MTINTAFLDELEGQATPALAPQDYFAPPPPPVAKKKKAGINYGFIESLEAGEHKEVQENKAKAVGDTANPERFDPEGSGYDIQTAQKYIDEFPITIPKPKSYQGDYVTQPEAFEAWVWHPDQNDYFKHQGSLDARTGMVLKGRRHPTWDLMEEEEKRRGSEVVRRDDGRYYAQPVNRSPQPEPMTQIDQSMLYAPEDPQGQMVLPEPGPIASLLGKVAEKTERGLKQVWNKGVADTAHELGKSDDPAMFKAVEVQKLREKKRGRLRGNLSEDEIEDIKRQLALPPKARESEDLKKIEEIYPLGGAKNEMPKFNIPPGQDAGDYIADTVAGITTFVAKIAFLKKLLPGAPSEVVWEIENISSGGKPGRGAAVNAALQGISHIPTVTAVGKGAKVAAGGGLFGGLTYAEGGNWVDVAVSTGIGAGFQAWDIHKQNQWLKEFRSHLKKTEYAKAQKQITEGQMQAKQVYEQDLATGVGPAKAKFKYQRNLRNATRIGERALERIGPKIDKAVGVVARKLHHGKMKGKESELAEKIVKKGLTPKTAKELKADKVPRDELAKKGYEDPSARLFKPKPTKGSPAARGSETQVTIVRSAEGREIGVYPAGTKFSKLPKGATVTTEPIVTGKPPAKPGLEAIAEQLPKPVTTPLERAVAPPVAKEVQVPPKATEPGVKPEITAKPLPAKEVIAEKDLAAEREVVKGKTYEEIIAEIDAKSQGGLNTFEREMVREELRELRKTMNSETLDLIDGLIKETSGGWTLEKLTAKGVPGAEKINRVIELTNAALPAAVAEGETLSARQKPEIEKIGKDIAEFLGFKKKLFFNIQSGKRTRGYSQEYEDQDIVTLFIKEGESVEEVERAIIHEIGHLIHPAPPGTSLSAMETIERKIRKFTIEKQAELKAIREPTPAAVAEGEELTKKEIEYEQETIIEPAPSTEVEQRKTRGLVSTGKLDPTNPKEATEIVERHKNFVEREKTSVFVGGIFETKWDSEKKDYVTESIEYTSKQVDTAYRTIQKSVPSLMPDTELFAMPGKEAQLQAIAKKMQKLKGVSRVKKKGVRFAKPTALPKAKTKQEDHIKAVYKAAATESTKYALNGVFVDGDNLVATDGRRMFIAKGKWGKGGIYLDKASLAKGLLGKVDKEALKFPKWQDIVPDVSKSDAIIVDDLSTIWRHIKQAESLTTEEALGVTILVNKDGSLGFASASPEVGHVEINIYPGAKILGGVNPRYLLDAIAFHAMRGDTAFEFYFPNWERPMLTKSLNGKTSTIIMPVNIDTEPSETIKEAIIAQAPAEKQPKAKGLKKKVEPTVDVPSQQGGFVGGRPGTASTKVSAIVKEDMATGSKNADAFLRRTKGFTSSGQPGVLRRVAKSVAGVFEEFHYLPDLPKQKEYADVREAFRHTEEIKRLAYDTAVEKMKWALKPIEGVKWETRARMKALEMKIIADDLAEDVEKGIDLPADLTEADIKTMKLRAEELYDKYPSVRDAYDRVRGITQDIGDLLVSEGMLEASRAREFYFPHKVIKYLRENDSFFGIPTKKPADYKKGYLKKRKGGYDYSTDIMERLVEHWGQVQRDVDYSRFLATTLKEEQANYFKKEHSGWKEFTKTEDGKKVRNLIPEGYKEVTVLPGRFYYATHGVTEDMAKAIIAQNLDSIEEMLEEDAAKQVRKVLAVGKKKSFIVREPIARQIHNMPTMPISTAPAYLAVKGFNTFVKGQILFNPLYAVPFHVTNFVGDAHKVFVALPSALKGKYLVNYWKEIIAAHQGEKSERFEMAQKYGVIGSGWIGTELPELKAIIPEIERAEISGAGKHLANKVKLVWNMVKKVGSGREDWLRYALFDRLMDLEAEGKDITKYAIKDSKTLSGISDKGTLAAKIARDIAGDYAAIGKTGRMLSDLTVPFYRWMHLNLPWWPRMIKEYAKKGATGRLIAALLAAAAPYVLSMIWNYSDPERRKFEKSLPYWKRWNFHIVSLRGKKMYYIPLPIDDVLNFLGVPEHILDFQRYQRGMITGSELAKRIAWNSVYEPGMSIVNSVGGLVGVIRDTVGVTTFPDIKPWLEKRWSRKGLNIAGDIFGAPAQLGKAIQREGIEVDGDGNVILGPKTRDLLNRAWMGIRPYSVDLQRTKELKAGSVYKRTVRKKGYIKGAAHKGKKRSVDSLNIQLEGEAE